jgi:hypothetical protein
MTSVNEPLIYKLKTNKLTITPKLHTSVSISYPLYKYGYSRYYPITQLNAASKLENKQKICEIVNEYDVALLKDKLNIKDDITLDFFKLWEIDFLFDLFKNKKSFLVLNDKDKQCYNYLKYNKHQNIYTETKDKVDVIICNTNNNNLLDTIQEQHEYITILKQIDIVIKQLKTNGSCVLKLFESMTEVSLNFLDLLCSMFAECYIIKPLTSNQVYSEKYFVGISYISTKLDLTSIIDKLKSLKSDMHINQVLSNFNVQSNNYKTYETINKTIANNQYKVLNSMMTYVSNENYFGDAFHTYQDNQKTALDNWINIYVDKKHKVKMD